MPANLAIAELGGLNMRVDRYSHALTANVAGSPIGPTVLADAAADERRTERRRRVLMSGKITGGQRHASIDCAIRNLSSNGACVRLNGFYQLPEHFQLFVQREGLVRDATVMWQTNFFAGISFSGWERKIADTDFTDRNSVLNMVKSMGIAKH